MGNTAFLPVGGDVEENEKHQIRGEDTHSGEGGKLLAGAVAGIGQPGEVGGSEVGPRREIDEAWNIC